MSFFVSQSKTRSDTAAEHLSREVKDMLDLLLFKEFHDSGRLDRLAFAKKFWIAALVFVGIIMIATLAGDALGGWFYILAVPALPFLFFMWRLVFWRVKDCVPYMDHSLIWVIVVGIYASSRFIPLLGYVLVQVWPPHVAPDEKADD